MVGLVGASLGLAGVRAAAKAHAMHCTSINASCAARYGLVEQPIPCLADFRKFSLMGKWGSGHEDTTEPILVVWRCQRVGMLTQSRVDACGGINAMHIDSRGWGGGGGGGGGGQGGRGAGRGGGGGGGGGGM